MTAQKPDAFRQ